MRSKKDITEMPNELKFIDEIDLDTGWEIETDTGFKPISKIYKTIEYEKYILKTENELLECADLHKVFTDNYEEVFVKDLSVGDKVITKNGIETVLSVENTHIKENMYDITVDDENHRYYSNGILSHNTTTMACYFLWYVLFTQDKACAVLANKGATARQIVGRIELAYMNLPKWLQSGITVWNKGSFCLENGSSIMSASTSSDSVRGSSFSLVMIDEAAFVEHWDEFYKSTYPTISSGEETRLILVSTFNGQNHFYDMWTDAIAKRSLFHPTRVDWWDVPGRDEKWHQDQLKIMSEEDFAQEYGNEALGSGFTLINSKGFSLVEASKKNPIQFTLTTKIYDVPIRGHKYMLTCDCADTGTDYSTISVIDITEFPYKQVATFKDNKITHLMFPHMILQLSVKYNDAAILVESNDVGKVILHILNYELECETVIRTRIGTKTQLGQRTTVKSKAIGCARLKDMIESGNLIIQDKATIEELKHFVIHNQTYSGEEGFHDDMVMGLVIFAYFVSSTAFRTEYDKNFVDEMNPQYEQEIIEALTPLPIFSNEKENPLEGLPKGFLD